MGDVHLICTAAQKGVVSALCSRNLQKYRHSVKSIECVLLKCAEKTVCLYDVYIRQVWTNISLFSLCHGYGIFEYDLDITFSDTLVYVWIYNMVWYTFFKVVFIIRDCLYLFSLWIYLIFDWIQQNMHILVVTTKIFFLIQVSH